MRHWINPKSQIEYRRPVAVDLFAGAGGFSLGIEQAGFDVLVAVEYDPIHACTYCFNFPLTEVLCADVSTVTGDVIRQAANRSWITHLYSGGVGDGGSGGVSSKNFPPSPCPPLPPSSYWDGQIDLVFGGPPCQGFSMMGKRELEDDRNSLIFHFCRLVIELNPRYFVMENVPGMAAGKYKALLLHLISNFEAAGYHIQKGILNAADFGVPQKRRRLFVIGTRQELKVRSEELGVKSEELGVNNSLVSLSGCQPKRSSVTVKDAIADLPDIDYFPELANSDEVLLSTEQLQQLQEKSSSYVIKLRSHPFIRQGDKETRGQGDKEDKGTRGQGDKGTILSSPLPIPPSPHPPLSPFPPLPNFSYPRLWNPQLLTSSMQTQHQENSKIRFGETLAGELETISRLRRLDLNGLCHTLRAGTDYLRGSHTSPRPIHPTASRVISVREAARLHSFPDWFRFHQTKWHGFRQVGNAVPPLLAQAIAEKIIAALCVVPFSPQQPLELGDTQLLRFTPSQAKNHFKL
ncbi:DNA cytosine methyltransferase [Tolypothrix sp. VBCCA 56010]|uniref:DNA cytosine methyltransferase n=1 Tax=Tolypothrix sp. VBCCA 56010 TaxID=3137731 RepID=UPI003D7EBAE8